MIATASTMLATATYVYADEDVNAVLDDADLIKAHSTEVPHFEQGEFEPNKEYYNGLQDLGALHCMTVRHEGELVGYQTTLMQYSHKSKGAVMGIVDAVYVYPKHRLNCGMKLITEAANRLRDIGVTDLYHLVPLSREWGTVLRRHGFKHIENVYHKGL